MEVINTFSILFCLASVLWTLAKVLLATIAHELGHKQSGASATWIYNIAWILMSGFWLAMAVCTWGVGSTAR